mmetsp:Transcript_77441/g.160934  ORF Transcript_77441/g.160934 Transcript_77441/m.160934 type:complete len:208 (+) Transcript_77441:558-1181(+)
MVEATTDTTAAMVRARGTDGGRSTLLATCPSTRPSPFGAVPPPCPTKTMLKRRQLLRQQKCTSSVPAESRSHLPSSPSNRRLKLSRIPSSSACKAPDSSARRRFRPTPGPYPLQAGTSSASPKLAAARPWPSCCLDSSKSCRIVSGPPPWSSWRQHESWLARLSRRQTSSEGARAFARHAATAARIAASSWEPYDVGPRWSSHAPAG